MNQPKFRGRTRKFGGGAKTARQGSFRLQPWAEFSNGRENSSRKITLTQDGSLDTHLARVGIPSHQPFPDVSGSGRVHPHAGRCRKKIVCVCKSSQHDPKPDVRRMAGQPVETRADAWLIRIGSCPMLQWRSTCPHRTCALRTTRKPSASEHRHFQVAGVDSINILLDPGPAQFTL